MELNIRRSVNWEVNTAILTFTPKSKKSKAINIARLVLKYSQLII
jgi:hypothetical protein